MKKVYIIIILCVLAFAVFAGAVIVAFNSVSNNPVDKVAIPYIRQNVDLQNKYGELIWIGRNVLYGTKNKGSTIEAAYTVEIESGRVIVCVTLMETGGKLEAISLKEIEMIPNAK